MLVEVGAGKEATVGHDDFKQLVKDITLQIAAASPMAVSREQVDPAVVAKEREIAAELGPDQEQAAAGHRQDRRRQAREVLPDRLPARPGLREAELARSPSRSTSPRVAKQLGDEITVRRFVRFQVGEALPG